jgi:GNAT superfamily N-acetyltransferase
MIRLERVDWLDPRAVALRAAMDEESGALYADVSAALPRRDRVTFARLLAVDPTDVVATVIAVDDAAPAAGTPVGHAGLKRLHDDLADALEVKKVVVSPERRGEGISWLLMVELESIARGLGAARLVLQTGDRQPAAVALYQKLGYEPMPAFGGYEIFPPSLHYAKRLD